MDLKDKADILSKKADIIYKKVVILLATVGGSGAYSIKFMDEGLYFVAITLGIVFIFGVIGLGTLYKKLDILDKEIKL